MNLEHPITLSILRAAAATAGGAAGRIFRLDELRQHTGIDPAVVKATIDELVKHRLLMLGATDDRFCLSRAGALAAKVGQPRELVKQ